MGPQPFFCKRGLTVRIDTHTHVFHPRTTERLFEEYTGYFRRQPEGDGLADTLEEHLREDGFTHAVILNAALADWQVEVVNNFTVMLREALPWAIPFGAMHPGDRDWESHLEQLRDNGIKGVKLHPEFQNENIDDPRYLPMFESMPQGFICTIHMGHCYVSRKNYGTPAQLAQLAKSFPQVRFVAAHMGGHNAWEEAIEVFHGGNVYLDTAFSLTYMPKELVRRFFREYPRENILFGSDWPFCRAKDTVRELETIAGLTESEIEDLFRNGARLLSLEEA